MNTYDRYCFTLDLVDDPVLIQEYEDHHRELWPEVVQSFREAGIRHLEMYRTGTRVVMLFDVDERFSFERKAQIDRTSAAVQRWETLMSKYQQAAPGSLADEKWVMMKRMADVQVPR